MPFLLNPLTGQLNRVPGPPVGDRSSFVFQPGGTTAGNVYATWSALYTDLVKTSGVRSVLFDNTFTAVPVIPAGVPYNLANVSFAALPGQATNMQIQIANGATFSGFPDLTYGVVLVSMSNSPVFVTPSSGPVLLLLDNGSSIAAFGSAEMIHVADGGELIILLKTACSLAASTVATVNLGSSCIGLIYMTDDASVVNNTLASVDDTSVMEILLATASATVSPSQTNFLGAIVIGVLEAAAGISFDPSLKPSGISAQTVQAAIDTICTTGTFTLDVNTGSQSNAGTGQTDLISFAIPAGVMPNAGDRIYYKSFGTFASNANIKTLKAFYGSTQLITSGALVLNGGSWTMESTIIRISGTTQIAITKLFTSNATLSETVLVTNPTATLSGAVTIKATGQSSVGANDVTELGHVVELGRKPA